MAYDSDDDDGAYASCAHCGKTVYAGVFECPYCFKDPSGEDFPCQNCGRALPADATECPYCKSYTGDTSEPQARKVSPLFLIAIVAAILLMVLMAILHPFG